MDVSTKDFVAQLGEQMQRSTEAFERLEKLGLPTTQHEEYRFTPVVRMLEKAFSSIASNRLKSSISSIENLFVPGFEANLIVFSNGVYQKHLSRIVSPPHQVMVSELSLEDAGGLLNVNKDSFAELNRAQWTEGVHIRVLDGQRVDAPFMLIHLSDCTNGSPVSHSRFIMKLETGSEVTVFQRFESTGNNASFSTWVEEIDVAPLATLNYYKLQNESDQSIHVANTLIHQADKSTVNTFTLTLSGQLVRNNLTIQIDGENCESHFHGLYLLNGKTLADNHTVVDHMKPNSFSSELYKGIMDDQAKGVFNGKIYVRPHAQKTNAFQSNRNVLLSENATINTKPQLEIWADDVKCSHGCTTGQLDEEALFYLQSRGIAADSARAMLLYAFASEVLETVKDESLKNFFDHLIAERLHKNL
jgi:Fe-S cluster assembly protein SufD